MRDHFIRSLPLVASALGRKYGLRVSIGGSEAATDGNTIMLPALPLDSPPEMMNLARGFLDHEAAHIRDTDIKLLQKAGLNPLEHHIFNSIEDWRVEKVLGDAYPGCRRNFQWLVNHFFVQTPVNDQAPLDMDILNWLLLKMRSWSVPELEAKVERLRLRLASAVPVVLAQLEPILGEIKNNCPDTGTAIAFARRIHEVLRDLANPPTEPVTETVLKPSNDDSDSQRRSQVVQVAAEGASDKSDSQGETQPSSGSSQDQPEQRNDTGEDGVGHDTGEASEAVKQPQESQENQSENAPDQPRTSPPASESHTETEQAASSGSGSDTDSQANAQEDDQAASVINSLLSKPENELPQSIGEILGRLLNDASREITAVGGALEVAQVGPRVFPELTADDLKQTRITGLALKCRLASLLQSLTLKKVQAGYQGRLDTNRLHRLSVGDPRVFQRSGSRIGLDTAVHLLLDASASMSGAPIQLVSLSAYALCEALTTVPGISVGATVFPGGKILKRRRSRAGTNETVAPVLDHDQRMHQKFRLSPEGGTPMGEALWWVMQRLSVRREKRKIILILTDGEPNHLPNTLAAIKEARRQGFELYGLGLKHEAIKSLLPGRSLVIHHLRDLPQTLFQLLGRAMSLDNE